MFPKQLFVAILALLLTFADVHAAEERRKLKDSIGLTREHVVNNHKRRRSQLEKLIGEAKTQLDDHHAGRKLMETEEFETVTKRIGLYETKLSKMPEEPDEKDVMRALEREQQRMERRSRREL